MTTATKPFSPSPKVLSQNPSRLEPGHRLCPGCTLGTIARNVLSVTEDPVIAVSSTGCFEICTGAFPYTAWQIPWIHSLFENAASVAAGLDALKQAWRRKGLLDSEQEKIKIVVFAGDGASYDIGFQWISGAFERGHDLVYVCTDNEGYMNTGYQRSSATPWGGHTSTTPIGSHSDGKAQNRKNLTQIFAAHDIPYVAQASPSHMADLVRKAHKAFEIKGPAFLNILSSCPTNWKFPTKQAIEILKVAVETNFWPLYEVEKGKYKLNFQNRNKKDIKEFLSMQRRFKHLLKDEKKVQQIQEEVDREFDRLKKLSEIFA